MLIVLSCPWIRYNRANRVVGVLRSGWKFFWDIGRLAPTVQIFFSPVGCFLQKIGVTTRGGGQNARKSRKKLKITQNMYFDVFLRHLKFHNVWTMFHPFFLHFTIFVVFYSFSPNCFHSLSILVNFFGFFFTFSIIHEKKFSKNLHNYARIS